MNRTLLTVAAIAAAAMLAACGSTPATNLGPTSTGGASGGSSSPTRVDGTPTPVVTYVEIDAASCSALPTPPGVTAPGEFWDYEGVALCTWDGPTLWQSMVASGSAQDMDMYTSFGPRFMRPIRGGSSWPLASSARKEDHPGDLRVDRGLIDGPNRLLCRFEVAGETGESALSLSSTWCDAVAAELNG